jgi:hypothetical protein
MHRSTPKSGEPPAAPEPMLGGITVRGRSFAPEELLRIRAVIEDSPEAHRFAISKRVCEALDWRQPNGRLKDRACRDVITRLHDIGFLRLPSPRRPPVRRRPVPITARSSPRPFLPTHPRDIERASFSIVTGCGDAEQEGLWNEYVERYHYLGYGVPLGAHIKYFIQVRQERIACLAFAGAAWRVEARDQWIGWSEEQRKRNLRYVVNNTRFLIFPWIAVPNLASRLLSLAVRRLPADWNRLYAYRPLLLETFVHAERHTAACYRAANWTWVGHTKGRGRMDRHFKAAVPKKAVLLYPLVKDASERLRA